MADPGLTQMLTDKLLSETGLIGGLLFAALLYVSRQWSNEREAHAKTIERLWELSEKAAVTSQSQVESNNRIHEIINRLISVIPQRGGRQS